MLFVSQISLQFKEGRLFCEFIRLMPEGGYNVLFHTSRMHDHSLVDSSNLHDGECRHTHTRWNNEIIGFHELDDTQCLSEASRKQSFPGSVEQSELAFLKQSALLQRRVKRMQAKPGWLANDFERNWRMKASCWWAHRTKSKPAVRACCFL